MRPAQTGPARPSDVFLCPLGRPTLASCNKQPAKATTRPADHNAGRAGHVRQSAGANRSSGLSNGAHPWPRWWRRRRRWSRRKEASDGLSLSLSGPTGQQPAAANNSTLRIAVVILIYVCALRGPIFCLLTRSNWPKQQQVAVAPSARRRLRGAGPSSEGPTGGSANHLLERRNRKGRDSSGPQPGTRRLPRGGRPMLQPANDRLPCQLLSRPTLGPIRLWPPRLAYTIRRKPLARELQVLASRLQQLTLSPLRYAPGQHRPRPGPLEQASNGPIVVTYHLSIGASAAQRAPGPQSASKCCIIQEVQLAISEFSVSTQPRASSSSPTANFGLESPGIR